MKVILQKLIPVVLILGWALPSAADGALQLKTASGGQHEFVVELADTAEDRARGLMYRRDLADDAGMLFVFDEPRMIYMWMKNTFIPLDMIFLDETGKVLSISRNAQPHSLDTISSGQPARAVLEVVAGTADRIGLAEGDRASHPIFHSP